MEFANHLALTKRLGYIICKTCYINSNKLQHFEAAMFTLSPSLNTIACYFNVNFFWLLLHPMPDGLFEILVDKNTLTHTITISTILAMMLISRRFYSVKVHTRTVISTYIVQCFRFNLFLLAFVFAKWRIFFENVQSFTWNACWFKWKSVDNNVIVGQTKLVTTFQLGVASQKKMNQRNLSTPYFWEYLLQHINL